MFSTLSRCDSYLLYVASVTIDTEFSLSSDAVLDTVVAEILNAWVILQSRPLNLTGAIISRTLTYGHTTEYLLVGPRLLRGCAVSVHRARVTHARVQNRWLVFTPALEKLVLVPSSTISAMPDISPSVIEAMETFARTRLSSFVNSQRAHATFDVTIRLDDASAVYVASAAQALMAYHKATDTSFVSLPKILESEELTVDQCDDEGGWDLRAAENSAILSSRVLLADPVDVATAYIESTFRPLDVMTFAARPGQNVMPAPSTVPPPETFCLVPTFSITRVVAVEEQVPGEDSASEGEFVVV